MEGVLYRTATLDDAPAIAAMLNARDLEFFGAGNHWESTIRGNMEDVGFDLTDSSTVAITPNGDIIGFELLYDHMNALRANMWGHVDSKWRGKGIASNMITWAFERAKRNIAKVPQLAQVSVAASVYDQDDAGKHLMAEHGLVKIRSFYTMRLDFEGAPPETTLPDGFQLVSFAEKPDLRAFLEVDIDSFRDHWGVVETPIEEEIERWQDVIDTAPDFDPNYWWLAYYGDEPAGLIMTMTECNLGQNIAWVSSLGVRPLFRKRGLGTALLGHALSVYHARGSTGIALGVDASSMTNAVALYERAGMKVYLRRDVYEKILREGIDLSRH